MMRECSATAGRRVKEVVVSSNTVIKQIIYAFGYLASAGEPDGQTPMQHCKRNCKALRLQT
jgi:hypothetical protein